MRYSDIASPVFFDLSFQVKASFSNAVDNLSILRLVLWWLLRTRHYFTQWGAQIQDPNLQFFIFILEQKAFFVDGSRQVVVSWSSLAWSLCKLFRKHLLNDIKDSDESPLLFFADALIDTVKDSGKFREWLLLLGVLVPHEVIMMLAAIIQSL